MKEGWKANQWKYWILKRLKDTIISELKVYSFATDCAGDINDIVLFSWQRRESGTNKPVIVQRLMEIKCCKFNSFCSQSSGCAPPEIYQMYSWGERLK